MAHGVVILECPRTPQSEVWARSYGVLSGALLCGTAPSSVSAVVRDSTPQGVTPGSPDSLEGRNSMNTCSNGASEESIGIYTKSRCQWSGCSIDSKLEPQSYGQLKPQGPAAPAKAPRGWVVFQNKSVSWKSLRRAA